MNLLSKRRRLFRDASARSLFLSIVVVVVAGATGLAIAGGFEDGVVSFDKRDYVQAAESFRKEAEDGDARAQSSLGEMYFEGMGVAKDNTQAIYWHEKAIVAPVFKTVV